MGVDFVPIGSLDVIGHNFDTAIGFEINEDRRALHPGPDLLGIENVKEDNFMPVVAEGLNVIDDGFRLLVEIGDDDGDAASVQEILKVLKRFREIGAGASLGVFESCEEARELAWARGGTNVLANLVVKDDKACGVALIADCKVKERCGDEACVIHFGRRAGRVLHGVAGVEENGELTVGFSAIPLEIAALSASKKIPI